MKTKKIALVTEAYWPLKGGVEEAVRQLAAHLPAQFQCTVYTHHLYKHPVSLFRRYGCIEPQKEIKTDPAGKKIVIIRPSLFRKAALFPLLLWGVPLLRRGSTAPKLFDFLFIFYRYAYKKMLKRYLAGYDLVHCYATGYIARCAQEVCKEHGVPIVQLPSIHFGRWGDSPRQMEAYTKSDAVIALSSKSAEDFRNRATNLRTPIKVIPPVISKACCPTMEVKPLEGRFILFLGRRETHKGVGELLNAYMQITTDVKLVLSGPGEKIPKNAESERVIDMGEVCEGTKIWLLANCDFLCVPSRDETFGIVFAEAMSYGKPVVSTDIEPINEIVVNNHCGLLVPPADTSSLKDALEKMLFDDEATMRMGKNALDRFDKLYSPDVTVGAIAELYGELIEGSGYTRRCPN